MKSKESEDEQVNYMFFFLNNNESSLQRTINKRSVAHYLWKDLLQIFFLKKKKKTIILTDHLCLFQRTIQGS